jgi:murein DD-endopeptidase MepM/ murein hydrolase activator NlpD
MEASRTHDVMIGRFVRLVLPVTIVVFMGASSPWIAKRAPRFLFPALAMAVAGLVTLSFANSLARFVRHYSGERRLRFFPVVVNAVAMVFLVILPFTHLLRVIAPPRDGTPPILTGFGAWLGAEGYPRPSPHRGIDVAGRTGGDVLAAAGGRVTVARDNRDLCGLIVVIDHDPGPYRTVYCHFSVIAVRVGDSVKRGQRIGAIGTSGQRALAGFEHVHLELQRGLDMKDIEDPLPRMVGCFDETKLYRADRLVLTYPVNCR